jgi:hypothetical protein
MKTSVITMLVVGAAVAALAFAAPARTTDDPKKDAKAQELEELRLKCDALEATVAENKTKLDQVLKYLNAQAEAARSMQATLDDSEQQGFTYGINPNSRIVLLEGWRAQLATQQEAVPGAPPKPVNGNGNGNGNGGTPPAPPPKN